MYSFGLTLDFGQYGEIPLREVSFIGHPRIAVLRRLLLVAKSRLHKYICSSDVKESLFLICPSESNVLKDFPSFFLVCPPIKRIFHENNPIRFIEREEEGSELNKKISDFLIK